MAWPALESEPADEFERRQLEGLVFHRLVQQHLLGLSPEMLGKLASGTDLGRWWHAYLSSNLGLAGHALHTELALSAPVGPHRLVAKYDLVAVKDGQAIIFDWKTYAHRPSEEQLATRWQTRVYRYLLAHAGGSLNAGSPFSPRAIRMVYWFAEFPSEPATFGYDEAQLERDRSTLKALISEISAAQSFPLTEDRKLCRFCVYRSYCNRGQAAADWKDIERDVEPEAGLELNFEQIQEIEF